MTLSGIAACLIASCRHAIHAAGAPSRPSSWPQHACSRSSPRPCTPPLEPVGDELLKRVVQRLGAAACAVKASCVVHVSQVHEQAKGRVLGLWGLHPELNITCIVQWADALVPSP
jgi:hypothetical protein